MNSNWSARKVSQYHELPRTWQGMAGLVVGHCGHGVPCQASKKGLSTHGGCHSKILTEHRQYSEHCSVIGGSVIATTESLPA